MGRRTTRALAAGAAIVSLTAPATAQADVEWITPPGCSSRESVLQAVTRALGLRSNADVAAIRARAVVEARGPGWRVELSTPGGERTLDADTCDQLADAVALILALASDPARAAAPPAAAPPAAASVAPPGERGPPGGERRSPPAPATRTPPLAIGAGQLADVGTLPGAALGAVLFVGLRVPPLRIEIAGAIWGLQRGSVGDTGAGGELSLFSAVAQGCLLPVERSPS